MFAKLGISTTIAVVLAATLAAQTASAQTFPADAKWTPLHRHGAVYSDPLTSPEPTGEGPIDSVGDTTNPASYIFSDSGHLYFRLRMAQSILNDPSNPNDYVDGFYWACAMDVDSDLIQFELGGYLNGGSAADDVDDQVDFATMTGDSVDTVVNGYDVTTHAEQAPASSTFGPDPNVFADFAIDNTDLAAMGVDANTPIRFSCGTADNSTDQLINLDWVGFPGQSTLPDVVSDSYLCGPTGCQVCTTDSICGRDCLPCGGSTPTCLLMTGVCDDGTACNVGDACASGETCSASWQCGGCQVNSDCPTDTPVCDTQTGTCNACTNDSQCHDPTPHCDKGTGACVGCVDSTQCVEPHPFCDGTTQTCVTACTGDGLPSCPDPTMPACNTTGALSGTCSQCDATNTTQCDGTATPFCDDTIGTCVECRRTTDCPLTEICNTTTHMCGGILPTPDAALPDATVPADARMNDARIHADASEPDAAVVIDAPLAPDAHVTAPDAHVTTPDAHVTTPDAHVTTPDAAVTTPDAHVTIDAPVVTTPDAAAPSPDAHIVVTPDAASAAPDAKRFADAGGTTASAGKIEGGGLGCSIGGQNGSTSGVFALLAMFGLVIVARRRRA